MTPGGRACDDPLRPRPASEVLDRRVTATGEIVLRRSGEGFELITDGAFAMASHLGGRSERRQVDLTIAAVHRPRHLVVAGLGLGLALAHAVGFPGLRRITVVEIEQAVIDWHRTLLRELTAGALDDPRVQVVNDDIAAVVHRADEPADALVLDVDNGPSWLLRPDNARLYEPPFLDACADLLQGQGALSVWGQGPSPPLVSALRRRFADVEEVLVPVPRGEPDWICVARGPRPDRA